MTETGLFSSRGSPVVIRRSRQETRAYETTVNLFNKVIKAGKMVFHPEE